MFAMALPYALLGMMRNTGGRRRMYALAVALLLAGSVSTQRKTGLVVPCAAMAVLTVYRPRDMLRLLPAGLVLVAVIQVTVPGAIVGVKAQLVPQNIHTTSTEGRTEDYDATHPDIVRYAAFGRGYGTYDPHKYRFLDNEYLHRLIEEGVVGTAAFIALLVTGIVICVRTGRRLDPIRGSPAEASVAALAAFAISCAIYDALAYAQSGYMLFLVAGIAVCTSMEARQRNPSRTEVSDVRDRRTGAR
jgi:O-antigen ligase